MTLGREKMNFLSVPTPLDRLNSLSDDLKLDLYIKRDDLTDFGAGGNKLRKLEYFVKDALDNGATMLMTVGGAQTNHGRLTATMAAKYRMKSAILSADTYPGEISANLLLDGIIGCHVYLAKTEDGEDSADKLKRMISQVAKEWEGKGEKVYYVPMGGSNELGMLGYYDCMTELASQIDEFNDKVKKGELIVEEIKNPHIVVTIGSYGTYMGLLSAIANEKLDCKLTGVTILPYENPKKEVLDRYSKIQDYFNLPMDITDEDVELVKSGKVINQETRFRVAGEYDFGAYNNAVPEIRRTICNVAGREGIFLDPCYTGKTFHALERLAKAGYFSEDETVIFIHTGGFPGLYTGHHRKAFEEELKGFIHEI